MSLTKITAIMLEAGAAKSNIGSGGITVTEIATDAVETDKIKAAAVTQAKMSSGVAGTGPAFSAYLNAQQSVTSATLTKVQINTESFDTASCYDNAINYRFTPNVAGYYQVNFSVSPYTTVTSTLGMLYKNGSEISRGTANTSVAAAAGSRLVYMNGTTDYLELWGYLTGTTPQIYGDSRLTYFDAHLARAA